MNPKRILFAGLFHETHTFVANTTELRDFTVLRGEEMLRCAGDSSPMGGALEAAARLGWEVVPTLDMRALPSGTVADDVFESFWSELRRATEPALAPGLDAVFLVLHGAMVTPSFPDVEGELLERLRALPGAAALPVFGVFDLHANFTARMGQHADCLVAYRENPHSDARESTLRAVALLERCLAEGRKPRTFWRHPPIVWPPTGTGTADNPMRALEACARDLESRCPDFCAVNVIAGFAFADIPETGVSFSIVTLGAEDEARAALDELCALAVTLREFGVVCEPLPDVALTNIPADAIGLTVIAEPSDNIGAGAPGDGTGLLRAFVQRRVQNAAVALNDPAAVERLTSMKPGARATLALGGKGSSLDAGPLTLEVELMSLRDGRFELEDKQSHLASAVGSHFDMGPCAVVRHEGVLILLTSHRTPPMDLGQWRSQGIDPEKLSIIGVKAAVAHRRAYEPIASRMAWADTPGPCSSRLRQLPYRNIQRPIFPLDEL